MRSAVCLGSPPHNEGATENVERETGFEPATCSLEGWDGYA